MADSPVPQPCDDEADDLFGGLRREPHARIPGHVFTCGLSPAAVVLYGWLSARYGGYKAGAFPAHATLAAKLRWSASTVKRALRDLTAAGWLTVTEQPGTSNLYRLVKSRREAASLRKRREAASLRERRSALAQDSGGRSLMTHRVGH